MLSSTRVQLEVFQHIKISFQIEYNRDRRKYNVNVFIIIKRRLLIQFSDEILQ
jgi:hypothetical protein